MPDYRFPGIFVVWIPQGGVARALAVAFARLNDSMSFDLPVGIASWNDWIPGFPHLEVVQEATSTNTVLAQWAAESPERWHTPAAVIAEHQTSGKGRLGREWDTPRGVALTMSVLVTPPVPSEPSEPSVPSEPSDVTWLPLVAGLAVVQGIWPTTGLRAALKWPNDVLIETDDATVLPGVGRRRKVGGILAEALPGGPAHGVVVGLGINVSQRADQLPVPTATSLALAAGDAPKGDLRPVLAENILRSFATLLTRWQAGDLPEIRDEIAQRLATLGEPVRAELISGETVTGTATGLGPDGALIIDGKHEIRSADIHHLR